MSESLMHSELKKVAVKELLDMGFQKEQIHEEYPIQMDKPFPHKWIVNVAGIAIDKKVCFECGNTSKHKLYELKEIGWVVRHRPYFTVVVPHIKYQPDSRNQKEQKAYLLTVYNEEIYEEFKDDPEFDFLEYNNKNEEKFNPWHHKEVWFNIPDSETTHGKELEEKMRFAFTYEGKHNGEDYFSLILGFITMNTCKEFLSYSDETKRKLIYLLSKLPDKFETQDGFFYKDKKHKAPPYPRNWVDTEPHRSNTVSWDDLKKIEERLSYYLEASKHGIQEYPTFDIVRVIIKKEEIAEALFELKDIYKLLLKPETKNDIIMSNIKKLGSWKWYIDRPSDWTSFFENYQKEFHDGITLEEFKKACRTIRKYDEEFKEYRDN
jgi:hypothetical protein